MGHIRGGALRIIHCRWDSGCWSTVVWWTEVDISQSFPFHSYSRGSRIKTKDKDVPFYFPQRHHFGPLVSSLFSTALEFSLAAGQWLQSSLVYNHQRGLSSRGCCGTFLLICVTSGNTKLSHWNLPLVFLHFEILFLWNKPHYLPIVFQVKKEKILSYSLSSIHESSCWFNIHSGHGFYSSR